MHPCPDCGQACYCALIDGKCEAVCLRKSRGLQQADTMIESLVALFNVIAGSFVQNNPARARELVERMRMACTEITGRVNERRGKP